MAKPTTPGKKDVDIFQTSVAVMIALVTLLGALVAWRAAIQGGIAGGASSTGLNAVLNAEITQIVNTTALHQHYRAYVEYVRSNALQRALTEQIAAQPTVTTTLELESLRAKARELAATQQLFFPNRYLGRNDNYEVTRELGEAWAQAGEELDLEPAEDFVQADQAQRRNLILVGILPILSIALFCFTLAQRIHPARKELRYGFAIAASLCLLVAITTTVLIETMTSKL